MKDEKYKCYYGKYYYHLANTIYLYVQRLNLVLLYVYVLMLSVLEQYHYLNISVDGNLFSFEIYKRKMRENIFMFTENGKEIFFENIVWILVLFWIVYLFFTIYI